MRRGEPRVKRTPTALRSSSYEGCVASSTLRPCGLGCHMLGPRCTACLGTNLIRNPASNGITSRPAPRPHRMGEDDSPKPSCNMYCCFTSSKHHFCCSFRAHPPLAQFFALAMPGFFIAVCFKRQSCFICPNYPYLKQQIFLISCLPLPSTLSAPNSIGSGPVAGLADGGGGYCYHGGYPGSCLWGHSNSSKSRVSLLASSNVLGSCSCTSARTFSFRLYIKAWRSLCLFEFLILIAVD